MNDLSIGEAEAKRASSLDEFAGLVMDALREISNTEWIYHEMIKNRQHNSTHCLIFITRNIRGAEKFLDAQYQLKEQAKANQAQATFDFLEDIDMKSILGFVERDKKYDNVSLFEIGIKAGLLPKQINKELKILEENGKLAVEAIGNNKRKRKGYYINHNKHKAGDRVVSILFKQG